MLSQRTLVVAILLASTAAGVAFAGQAGRNVAPPVAPAAAAPKKRIAVMNFEYGTVQSDVRAIFGGNQDVGKGVADLMVLRLVQSGVYSVIERKAIDKVMAEQNFSNSDRVDPNSAARLGKILGVDAIVVGSITQFGRDDKNTSVGGGAIGGITSRYGLGNVGKHSAKAVVGLTARVVSTDTAEILVAASGRGESTRTGATLAGAGGSTVGSALGALDMTSANFADTVLGEAVNRAVTDLSRQVETYQTRIPARVVAIDGLVADVNGPNLILNVGSRAGVRIGDRLHIARTGRTIKDPATGKVLRRVEDEIGVIVITDVDEQSSGGTFQGTVKVQVGDHVKN